MMRLNLRNRRQLLLFEDLTLQDAVPQSDQGSMAAIAQLDHKKVFSEPIVTEVVPLNGFYPAEAYHQNYVARHRDQPYIAINDLPKLARLQETFPALYRQ